MEFVVRCSGSHQVLVCFSTYWWGHWKFKCNCSCTWRWGPT